ncbi:MAG: peptidoglycan DD-metalloendopeptidase family protein [Chroococcus sp. CMT-3BRIN-NPC107]|jgi:murein DD-endopeptidase MepM/ murein hydrolase activator NlpD|nr:peptidoglycan DD-metalloendopeptidase family protein [Chroococcus sp. CMT-3BRIN-NPC107]
MTQHNDRRKLTRQKSLIIKSLSLIGVFGILSSNQVFAQTESASDNLVPLPTSEAAPIQPSTDRVQRLQRALSKPKVVRQEAAPQPRVSTYMPPSAASVRKTATQKTQDYNGAFIDPTDYSTGATSAYEPPSQVIFSQRSPKGKSQRQTTIATKTNSLGISSRQKVQPNASWVRNSRTVVSTAMLPVRANTSRISYSNSGRSPINRQKAVGKVSLPKILVSSYYNRTIKPIGVLSNNNTRIIFPLSMPATVTSLFGWRIHPITGDRRFHAGTDFGAAMGTPVVAAYSGNVAIADSMGGYGLTVVLDHQKFGQQTLYAHLSEIFVEPGQVVEQGTVIGRVGSTGNSTGAHLHFEVRQLTNQGWVATDPGVQLQGALAQLVESLRVASAKIPN